MRLPAPFYVVPGRFCCPVCTAALRDCDNEVMILVCVFDVCIPLFTPFTMAALELVGSIISGETEALVCFRFACSDPSVFK